MDKVSTLSESKTFVAEEAPKVMEKAEMARLPLTEIIEYRDKNHLCLYYERTHKNISEK